MAINSCSINAFTINSLKCRRTGITPPNPVFGKSHPYHSRINYSDREDQFVIDNYAQIEGPYIQMTLDFGNGDVISQTYENTVSDIIPMITINNLELNSGINININNLQINIKNEL